MVVVQEDFQYEEVVYDLPERGRTVPRKARKTDPLRGAKVLAVSFVLLCFGAGIAVAAVYARLAIENYNVTKLESAIASQNMANDQLTFQISQLRSVSRIETIATKQLGMVRPMQYGYLDYQEPKNVKAPEAGVSRSVAGKSQTQGNPVIRQIAGILSGIFGAH